MTCFVQKMRTSAGLRSRSWRQAIRHLGVTAGSLHRLFNSFGTRIQAMRSTKSSVDVISSVVIRCMNSSSPGLNEKSGGNKSPILLNALNVCANLREDSSKGGFGRLRRSDWPQSLQSMSKCQHELYPTPKRDARRLLARRLLIRCARRRVNQSDTFPARFSFHLDSRL